MAAEGEVSGKMEVPEEELQSSQSSLFPVSMSKATAQEWVRTRRQHLRPWSEFFQTSRLHPPKSLVPLGNRIMKNLDHFLSNYLCIFIVLIIFCILTSPLLLIVIGALGGALHVIRNKLNGSSFKVMNVEFTPSHQYLALGVASFPFLWLVGAGSVVLWILGVSFFIIVAHASLYQPQDEGGALQELLITA